MERVARIELASSRWQRDVIPLYHTRSLLREERELFGKNAESVPPPFWWFGAVSSPQSPSFSQPLLSLLLLVFHPLIEREAFIFQVMQGSPEEPSAYIVAFFISGFYTLFPQDL